MTTTSSQPVHPTPATRVVAPTGWRRWGPYVALTTVFAITCVGLGMWQFERRAETVARIELIQRNYDASPVELSSLVPTTMSPPGVNEWRPVLVTGEYRSADQMLVRNRSSETGPGFDILTPLVTDSGAVFLIDRGWVDRDDQGNPPTFVPPPPAGKVTVEARLRPTERTPVGQTSAGHLIPSIDLEDVARRWNEATYIGAYGVMESEHPSSRAGVPPAKPSTSEGNHLSYAFQWLAFAVLGIVALIWAVRRERRMTSSATSPPRPARSSPQKSDADVEDAIIDAS